MAIFVVTRRERRWHQWLSRARAGDLDALARLAEDAGTDLWRVAALLTAETYAAELVAATVRVALAPHTPMPRVGEVRQSLLRHLYQLAQGLPDTGAGVLAFLPLQHRAFLALAQVAGLRFEQVARVCEVHPATVRAGCFAARSALVSRGHAEGAASRR